MSYVPGYQYRWNIHFIQEPKTRGGRLCWSSCGVLLQRGILEGSTIKYYYFSFDQYRYLWTAIRGFISEFGLFSWRALSGQPTPCQALSFIMTTSKVLLPGVYRVEATIGKCRSSGLLRFNIWQYIFVVIVIFVLVFCFCLWIGLR